MAKSIRAELRRILGDDATEETINSIVALHLSVLDPLRDDLAKAKETADKLPAVQKELDDLKAANKDGDDWKQKYDDLKAKVDRDAENGKKTAAYRELLKEAGISEKRIDTVLKCTDMDGVKLNDKGEIENKADVLKSIKTEWADFVTTRTVHGANTETPPVGGEVVKSRADIYKTDEHGRFVMDAQQRQTELARIIANEQKGN